MCMYPTSQFLSVYAMLLLALQGSEPQLGQCQGSELLVSGLRFSVEGFEASRAACCMIKCEWLTQTKPTC